MTSQNGVVDFLRERDTFYGNCACDFCVATLVRRRERLASKVCTLHLSSGSALLGSRDRPLCSSQRSRADVLLTLCWRSLVTELGPAGS